MHPIIINSKIIEDIQQSTHSVRINCSHSFLPSIRMKVYMQSGPQPKDYNNIKTYMMHKKGFLVIGVNKWTTISKQLKHMRHIMSNIPFVAIIHKQTFKGDLAKCKHDLEKYNFKYFEVNAWNESDEILNSCSPKPICLGLQSSGYILMLQGPFQIYNKVPGYVYPAEYMKAHQYSTKICSY